MTTSTTSASSSGSTTDELVERYVAEADEPAVQNCINWTMSDAGIDGLALTWVDYVEGLEAFAELVVPELRRNGIRY